MRTPQTSVENPREVCFLTIATYWVIGSGSAVARRRRSGKGGDEGTSEKVGKDEVKARGAGRVRW